MTRRAQSSKRRWIARAKAGKWVPKEVVFHLDREWDWFERWEPHPTESGFLRLRSSAEDVRRGCGGSILDQK
jgi:hypothetical protein